MDLCYWKHWFCWYSQLRIHTFNRNCWKQDNRTCYCFFLTLPPYDVFSPSSSLHSPVRNQFLAVRYAFKQVRASRKEHPNVSSWEKKQLGSAALPAPTTNRHTGVQFVSEHKVCFFLFFYVRAAQCVLSVVTNCSSTLTWWLSIRSSPLRWKVTSPKADGGFGAERDPGLLTRGWRTWQEVESASQQLSKGEGDGWCAHDVQRSAFSSLHGSSRKRKKKKALIHWHIKGRQTQ